jgi:hypothetical protein
MAPLFLCNIENLVLPRVAGSSKGQVRLQWLCGKDCELSWSIGRSYLHGCVEHLACKFVSPPYAVVRSDKAILQVGTLNASPHLIGKSKTNSSLYEFADQFVSSEDFSNDAAASAPQTVFSKLLQRRLC